MIRYSDLRVACLACCFLVAGSLFHADPLAAQPPELDDSAAKVAPDAVDVPVPAGQSGKNPSAAVGDAHEHDHPHPHGHDHQHGHDHGQDVELTEEGKQAKLEYDQTHDRLTTGMIEMRSIHTRYCNGEQRTLAMVDRYLEVRADIRRLMNETYDAAMKLLSYSADDEAAQFMVTLIQYRESNDIYDISTLVGGANLIESGVHLVFVMRAVARSALANGDFKIAKQLYEALEEEHLEDVDKRLMYQMETIESQWNEEIKYRDAEHASDHLPRVLLKTTRGDVVLELFIDQAPSTVAHFIDLVEDQFYDEMDFYQVIDHLLALTGDPSGNGSGNSGKFLLDEHQREGARHAMRGSIAMAKVPRGKDTGEFFEHSGSSQFAIFLLPVPQVSKNQTVFGRVIEGMDAISTLRRVDPNKKKGKKDIVMPPDRIITAKVIRRPDKLPEPEYFDQQAAPAAP